MSCEKRAGQTCFDSTALRRVLIQWIYPLMSAGLWWMDWKREKERYVLVYEQPGLYLYTRWLLSNLTVFFLVLRNNLAVGTPESRSVFVEASNGSTSS